MDAKIKGTMHDDSDPTTREQKIAYFGFILPAEDRILCNSLIQDYEDHCSH